MGRRAGTQEREPLQEGSSGPGFYFTGGETEAQRGSILSIHSATPSFIRHTFFNFPGGG